MHNIQYHNPNLRSGRHKDQSPVTGQETSFEVSVNTKEKAGLNDVTVFVNPRILPEVYYDNNVLALKNYLNVEADIFNPVLDVTIDGRYILNGDYVSSNPSIVLKLWDENSLLLKTDTTGISVLLKYPCASEDCPFTAIYFTRPDVQWQPATGTTDFTMEFMPQNLPVGMYTLRAEARDVRDNVSGSEPYEITFQVVADNSIILQSPYPNPSTSIFNFDVVVTGDEQPERMQLEVINGNGQSVGEFILEEFFTGTNTILWDASNVPSGLYLYRLKLIREGKVVKSAEGKVMRIK
jgi:hypothetical protein